CTNGPAAFANRETQTFFHGDRRDQGHSQLHVVTRHHHLNTFRQFARTRYVRSTEVELRAVAFEERRVTTTFVFAQNVHFALELSMGIAGARIGQTLTTLCFVALGPTQQNPVVLTGTTFVEQLTEHLNAGHSGLGGIADTNTLNFFTNLVDTTPNTAGNYR